MILLPSTMFRNILGLVLWRGGAAQFQVRVQITRAKMHAWLDRALVIGADICAHKAEVESSPHFGGRKAQFWVISPRPFKVDISYIRSTG